MYTTSSIAPVFIVHRLVRAGLLQHGAKIVLVSSESGSISLRHEQEGGGNYAHHASKAALNMVGKLLSIAALIIFYYVILNKSAPAADVEVL